MPSQAELDLIAKNKAKKTINRPKKKRKSRYKTGFHFSVKCKNPNNVFQYRSGWEKTFGISLDNDINVISYEYETIKIPYILNNKTGKIRWYIPDFIVYYNNGDKVIYEVKNTSAMNNISVIKKAKAAELWAQSHGFKYIMITGPTISLMEKTQKAKK